MAYEMDNTEYLAALEEFGIDRNRAAWLFTGKSTRSGRRWAKEGAPYQVALIISMMQEFELTPEYIEALGARWRRKQDEHDAEEGIEDEPEDPEEEAASGGEGA